MSMNIQRVKNIFLFQINKVTFRGKEIIRIPFLSLALCLIGLIIFSPFSFYAEDGQVFFLGTAMKSYTYSSALPGNLAASELNRFVEEFLIIGWWLVAAIELPLILLVPLVDSFSVSQTIWIRLTSCSPVELSLVRFFWVITYALWLFTTGSLFIFPIAQLQGISPYPGLIDVLGLASFTSLCGGITVITMSIIRSIFSYDETIPRFLVIGISFLAPIGLYLIFSLIYLYVGNSPRYFPYAIGYPSIKLVNASKHFLASLGVGITLLIMHVFLSRSIPVLSASKKYNV